MSEKDPSIIPAANLKDFVFHDLSKLNSSSQFLVPEKVVFYSSLVLERYMLSSDYFEQADGKFREKILGMKLLKADQKPLRSRQSDLQDIGDTALVLTSVFSRSIDKKITDHNYYIQVGKTAYKKMDGLAPELFDIPHFYSLLSNSFETLSNLITLWSDKSEFLAKKHLLIDDSKLKAS